MGNPLRDCVTATPTDLLAGRFRLGDLLGVGGSASVFGAEDVTASDCGPVAVKLLHPHLARSVEARDSFLREVEIARSVTHPNLVMIHAAGVYENAGAWTSWLASELVAGGSVADLVATRGPVGVAEAIEVTHGVLAALGALHAAGYVHRDVTPGNVLLTGEVTDAITRDRVRLTDFGTADASGRVALARAGEGVVGTAAYISPEQALGNPVRAAADLYQTGAVLYFLLTGQPPFPRDLPEQVMDAHVSSPPPVPSALVAAARPLDRIVTRAMTKTPARRFRDADAFAAALDEAVPNPPVAAPARVAALADHRTRVLPGTTVPDLSHLAPTVPVGSWPDPLRPVTVQQPSRAGVGWLTVAVLLLFVGGYAAYSQLRPLGPGPAAVAQSLNVPQPSAVATTPEEQPTPTPTVVAVPIVAVPALTGSTADAVAVLRATGLGAGTVTEQDSVHPAGTLLGQRPVPGRDVPAGSLVDLVVASGRNAVPDVVDQTVTQAAILLRQAGFQADWSVGMSSRDLVDATVPRAGESVPLGAEVSLLPVPPESPTASAPATSPRPSASAQPSPSPSPVEVTP